MLSDAETEESLAASSRAILLLLFSAGAGNTTTRSKKNAQQTRRETVAENAHRRASCTAALGEHRSPHGALARLGNWMHGCSIYCGSRNISRARDLIHVRILFCALAELIEYIARSSNMLCCPVRPTTLRHSLVSSPLGRRSLRKRGCRRNATSIAATRLASRGCERCS